MTHIPPANTPVARPGRQEEREEKLTEDEEYEPTSIPVTHLNVSI